MEKAVYLGYVGAYLENININYQVNKIGGFTSHNGVTPYLPICDSCSEYLVLICQIFCPVDFIDALRRICIFTCLHTSCHLRGKNWKTFRFQENIINRNIEPQIDVDEFDPLFDDEEDYEKKDDTIKNMEVENCIVESKQESTDIKSNSNDQIQEVPEQMRELVIESSSGGFATYSLPSALINVRQEKRPKFDFNSLEPYECYKEIEETRKRKRDETSSGECTMSDDSIAYNFANIICNNPLQILRYSREGRPLHISKEADDVFELSNCKHCGSPNTFELQLMPEFCKHLKSQGIDLEFGTIIVATCSVSCHPEHGDSLVREECTIVQLNLESDMINNLIRTKLRRNKKMKSKFPLFADNDTTDEEDVDNNDNEFVEESLLETSSATKPGKLPNPKNWCYMNSSLQIVFNCKEFMEKIVDLVENFQELIDEYNVLKGLANVYSLWKNDEVGLEDLTKFRAIIVKKRSHFGGQTEEDVQEFILFILEFLEEQILKLKKDSKVEISNFVKDFFNYEIINVRECLGCSRKSEMVGEENMLCVAFPNSLESPNITDALKAHFEPEDVELTCEKCKHKYARQITLMKTLPKYLLVQIKRYFHAADFTPLKHTANVLFNNYLNMNAYTKNEITETSIENHHSSPEVEPSQKVNQGKFELQGFINHFGYNLNNGHYVSFIERDSDSWFRISDKVISVYSKETAFKMGYSNCYIFSYHQI